MSNRFHDQAIDVLRGTRDGDDLSVGDLRLLQDVVNGAELTEYGEAAWASIVDRVRRGVYDKGQLLGIENLTMDHEGYVYWRGKSVEHYSFPADRRQAMVEAAILLGATCRWLEDRGERVSSSAFLTGLDRLRFGDGIAAKRYAVMWAVPGRDKPVAAAYEIAAMDYDAAKQEVEALSVAFMSAHGLDRSSLRVQSLFTADDMRRVTDAIKSDMQWAQRALHMSAEERRDREAVVVQAIEKRVEPHLMKGEMEFVQQLAGAHLEAVRQQVAQAQRLAEQQAQEIRNQRNAERQGA